MRVGAGPNRVALKARQVLVEILVVNAARGEEVHTATPCFRIRLDHLNHVVDRFQGAPSREGVRGSQRPQHQSAAQLRMAFSEHGGDDRPVIEADHGRSFRPSCLHDLDCIPHLHFQIRKAIERYGIGETRAATVEMDQSTKGAQSTEKARKVGEFPHSLHVMDPGVDQEQVDIAVAYDLESDIEIAVLCVARAYGRPFMASEARAIQRGSG